MRLFFDSRLALFAAIFAPLCLACSGTNGPADGTPVPTAEDSTSECVEVQTTRIAESTTHKTWDADNRILTATSSNGETTSTLKWRYRADGQIIAYIGVEQPFQHDYQYDEQGNRTDFYLSYPAAPDLMLRSSAAPWMGTTYANEYDDSGRLAASTTTEYGDGQTGFPPGHSTFSEDAEGRCSEISSDQYGERVFSYDDAGRLAKVVKTGAAQGFCVNSTTTMTYDDAGRILETTLECSGGNGGPNNGGAQVTTHSYRADGSEVVESVDGLTDVGDGRSSVTRSAACLAQDAAIGQPPNQRCRVGMTP